jgi:mannitol-1-phosphate 5-dehydrogenase
MRGQGAAWWTMADRNILIFGAGRIGRSFIGQLFGRQGYEVVFVDVDKPLVEELNRRNEYPVVIRDVETRERQVISPVRAIHAMDHPEIARAISHADISATAVGRSALPAIAPVVAKGLLERERERPGMTLDIILAENIRHAAHHFREMLRESLPSSFPLEERVGLVETSIGKMVPIMTESDLEEDRLQVFAEPYNTLILDRRGFRGPIPEIPELDLKENMKAWVDRKAFIHNLGHAAAAYCGSLKHPSATFMSEVLDDPEVLDFTRRVMQQSAAVLLASYRDEFTPEGLSGHIEELLARFRNLGDTLFRVGCDLERKLGAEERFMGIIRMARHHHMAFDMILQGMSMGFCFRARDEKGRMYPADISFHESWKRDRDRVLREVCGLNENEDAAIIQAIKQHCGRYST